MMIERVYKELKQELGLGHYEGRKLAGISPPRNTMYRGVRLLDGGKEPFSPQPTLAILNYAPPQYLRPESRSKRVPAASAAYSITTLRRAAFFLARSQSVIACLAIVVAGICALAASARSWS